jgi:hypothetical protein
VYPPPENLTKLRSDWSTKKRATTKRRNRQKKWAGLGGGHGKRKAGRGQERDGGRARKKRALHSTRGYQNDDDDLVAVDHLLLDSDMSDN